MTFPNNISAMRGKAATTTTIQHANFSNGLVTNLKILCAFEGNTLHNL